MGKTIRAAVEIAAEPDEVWGVLTDFAAYKEWNRYIISAAGSAEVGGRLSLKMRVGGKTFNVSPKVVVAASGRQLRWVGHLGMRGIFDAEHRHDLEATAGGTRYIQSERFTGVLVPVLADTIAATATAFDEMNQALKSRVEGDATASQSKRRRMQP